MAAANLKGERRAVQRTMEALLAESRRRAQPALPGIDRPVIRGGGAAVARSRELPERVAELVFEMPARRTLRDLVLGEELAEDLAEFLDEYSQAGELYKHSLEPRHTLLLVGPPGNGKTSLAEAIACELSLPLLAVRYDAIVDSYLGETSSRLRKLIEFATVTPCVLFFDEFEAVAKERSDAQETGEIKRVVSSLLLQLDRLPSHTVIVCATNHPELLDRAIWRRFELQLSVDDPGERELAIWFDRFCASVGNDSVQPLRANFVRTMTGRNMSEVEAFTLDVRRKLILSRGKLTVEQAAKAALARLVRNRTRAGWGRNGNDISDAAPAAGSNRG